MSITNRPIRDSDGVVHYLDVQDQSQSCALASMGMVMRQVSRYGTTAVPENRTDETMLTLYSMLSPGLLFESQVNGQGSARADGTFAGTGTLDGNITPTMRRAGIPVDGHDVFHPTNPNDRFFWRTARITAMTPALVLVGWYQTVSGHLRRNGGHFIVAARVANNGRVVLLNPLPPGSLLEASPNDSHYQGNGRFEEVWYTYSPVAQRLIGYRASSRCDTVSATNLGVPEWENVSLHCSWRYALRLCWPMLRRIPPGPSL